MKISSKGRYGLRALIDLAVNSKEGHVSLISIANRNQISIHYLEHVFSSLKRGGIVKSVKGAQGGYVLAREAGKITAAQIIENLEGNCNIEPEAQYGSVLSDTVSDVINEILWEPLNRQTRDFLEQVTLQDLVDSFISRYEKEESMYYI